MIDNFVNDNTYAYTRLLLFSVDNGIGSGGKQTVGPFKLKTNAPF